MCKSEESDSWVCILTFKVCDVGKSFEPIELLPHIKKGKNDNKLTRCSEG